MFVPLTKSRAKKAGIEKDDATIEAERLVYFERLEATKSQIAETVAKFAAIIDPQESIQPAPVEARPVVAPKPDPAPDAERDAEREADRKKRDDEYKLVEKLKPLVTELRKERGASWLPDWQSVDNVFPSSYLIRVKTEAEQEKENMRRTDIMMTALTASQDKESGIVKDNETLEAKKVSRLEKMETKKREIDETVNMLEVLFPAKSNK
jgi:hypothetical protein